MNIEPYYEDKEIGIIIYHGDCLQIMPQFPDKHFGLCLTDPPYGLCINRKTNRIGMRKDLSRKANSCSWDENIPDKRYFNEMFRISNNQIVFGANYFWENFYSSQCYIIWDKRGNLPNMPFSPTEFAWSSFKKMPKKYLIRNHGFIKDSKDEKTGHPTQKPSELMIKIVEDFTKSSDLILDPFLGSGTTLVAAKKLGRKCIGIEISKEYCEIAKKRIESINNKD